MSGTLYVVATPIGNLNDTTARSLDVLKSVDYILAEDTRVTLKLLQHFGIQKKLISYSEHSSEAKEDVILKELTEGRTYALVSDAGTPAISDPGARLIQKLLEHDISIVPIPGASAVSTLVSVFGIPEMAYHFWGFFPIKTKKQKQLIENIKTIPGIHVFFESPFRIEKTLMAYFESDDRYYLVIGREMTKQFETFYRGVPKSVLQQLRDDKIKGEFCVGVIFKDRE